ncbi:MAG: sugar ABC transporter permease [Lachnospira sp.]|nr:sugar ABC transporter permease [Lachnospira sp.]
MKKRRKANTAFRHTGAFWLFVLPSLGLFALFFLLPLVLSIWFSFTDFDGWKKMNFIGLKNYTKILKDSSFYLSLGRTFIYTIVNLPFKVAIPLLLAALVTSKKLKGNTAVRTMIYIPVLFSSLVAGITINWMFSQEYGLVNFLLEKMGMTPLEWSLNPTLATVVISVASNWVSAGYYMLLYVGGINNISKELYEAASIDGSGKVNTFFHITVPLLLPTTFIVLLLSTVNLLKEYALIQGITLGGPGTSTTYIVQYIFSQGFDQYKYGYASAAGVLVSIVFIVIAAIQFKMTKGGGEV